MDTQRVEGHTPLNIRIAEWCADNAAIAANPKTPLGTQLEIAYKLLREQSNNIERLEKVNEALVAAADKASKYFALRNLGQPADDLCTEIQAALKMAKEPA